MAAAAKVKAPEAKVEWKPVDPPLAPERNRHASKRAEVVDRFLTNPPAPGQWVELFALGTPKSAASSATWARKRLGASVEVAVSGSAVVARVPEEAKK